MFLVKAVIRVRDIIVGLICVAFLCVSVLQPIYKLPTNNVFLFCFSTLVLQIKGTSSLPHIPVNAVFERGRICP